MQIGGEAFAAEAAGQPGDVVAQPRPDKGVEQGRGKALELAELRRHFGGGADEAIRELLAHDLTRPLLMRRVQIGEQKADAIASTPAARSARAASRTAASSSGTSTSPRGGARRSGDRQAMTAADQRPILPRNLLADRIMLRPLVAADVDDIAIAGSGDHAGHRPVMLQHGVGADRRAVQHMVDRCGGAGRSARTARRCRRPRRATGRLLSSASCGSGSGRISVSANTMSVKVPPTSTPIRYIGASYCLAGVRAKSFPAPAHCNDPQQTCTNDEEGQTGRHRTQGVDDREWWHWSASLRARAAACSAHRPTARFARSRRRTG